MPKRAAKTDEPSPAAARKKKARSTTAAAAAAREEEDVAATAALPLHQWKAVLTGLFDDKATLEAGLKQEGVKVTTTISNQTTHLILGKTGPNEHGKLTGVGSSKYNEAQEKNLVIVKEREVLGILQGSLSVDDWHQAKETAKIPMPTKKSPLTEKIVYCIQHVGEGATVSLVRLKKELGGEPFGMDFTSTRAKNALKKALDQCLSDGTIIKQGASFRLPDTIPSAQLPYTTAAAVQLSETAQQEKMEKEAQRLYPVQGRWRGLHKQSTVVSKSGRAQCAACQSVIAKGVKQCKVLDDSLFRMCVLPGDVHEGVTRGYVETGLGDEEFNVVARKSFFVHEECYERAQEHFEQEFHSKWARLRNHLLQYHM